MTVAQDSVGVVVFDLGGVICRFVPGCRLEALSVATALAPEQIEHAIWTSGIDADADRGRFTLEENVEAVIVALDRRIGPDDLLAAWSLAFPVDDDLMALANRLQRRRAILTNNGPLLEECCRRNLVKLDPGLQPALFAWRLGATKPNREAYDRAALEIGVAPTGLLLVDDNERNVNGAIDAGWRAIRFDSVQSLAGEFARLRLI
jgi:putative hydrolase of the HAD superfamily